MQFAERAVLQKPLVAVALIKKTVDLPSEQMHDGYKSVVTLLVANPSNVAAAQSLVEQQNAAENAMKVNVVNGVAKALAVLTPEQREKVGKFIEEHHGDFAKHVDYIHFNPVKHGFAAKAVDWPYSSIHRYVRQGFIGAGWEPGEVEEGRYGE